MVELTIDEKVVECQVNGFCHRNSWQSKAYCSLALDLKNKGLNDNGCIYLNRVEVDLGVTSYQDGNKPIKSYGCLARTTSVK